MEWITTFNLGLFCVSRVYISVQTLCDLSFIKCFSNHICDLQEQDSYGGGYDLKQSFVGMMADVHMWDHTLSPCEIHKYVDGLNFTPGNVLNWGALEFQITGKVIVEDKLNACY